MRIAPVGQQAFAPFQGAVLASNASTHGRARLAVPYNFPFVGGAFQIAFAIKKLTEVASERLRTFVTGHFLPGRIQERVAPLRISAKEDLVAVLEDKAVTTLALEEFVGGKLSKGHVSTGKQILTTLIVTDRSPADPALTIRVSHGKFDFNGLVVTLQIIQNSLDQHLGRVLKVAGEGVAQIDLRRL